MFAAFSASPYLAAEFASEVLAYPAGWDAYAAREKQFQDAERDRLLYVAATRAGTRLVVAQREKGNTRNPWVPLEKYLADCPSSVLPEGAEHKPLSERVIADDAAVAAAAAISHRWSQVCQPSYAVAAVKTISVTPTRLSPSAGEHGTEWGSVIHLLLENAMRDPTANLQQLACASLADQGLDSTYATEAIATVQAVMRSAIWNRAQSSTRRLVEVPFQTLMPADPNVADSVPVILRGVIDLVFREDERLGRGGLQDRCTFGRRAAGTRRPLQGPD